MKHQRRRYKKKSGKKRFDSNLIPIKRGRYRPQYRPLSHDKSSRSCFKVEDEESGNEISGDCELENPTDDIRAIKEGDFVSVSFKGKDKSSRFPYLCYQQLIEGGEFKVLGFESTDHNARSFVTKEDDVFTVPSKQIIGILPAPETL